MVGGGPNNFIVNQSPNLWIFGFKTFDLDTSVLTLWVRGNVKKKNEF